jgi:membrane-associated phospholipid phosphatase
VARTPTGAPDGPVRRLSGAADKSRLWLAIAVTSATVNLGVKPIARRGRPDRAQPALFEGRHVPMPRSASFPSGHSASAFAFAYAVGRHLPVLAVPIRLLAVAVAYSRVHTGVHYPGDVVIGSVTGAGTAAMVAAVADRATRPGERSCWVRGG